MPSRVRTFYDIFKKSCSIRVYLKIHSRRTRQFYDIGGMTCASWDKYGQGGTNRYEHQCFFAAVLETDAPTPWKKMLLSNPVWAINIAHFAENWGFYTLLTLLPTYVKDTLNSSPKETGLISSMPYLLLAIIIQISGQLADQMLKSKTNTFVRKVFTCTAFTIQGVFIFVAGQLLKSENKITAMMFLILAISLGGISWAGFSINHLDISLNWASILMGISNTFGTIPGMISPILASQMTSSDGAPSDWTPVFTFSAAVYFVGATFYGLMASGVEQEWGRRLKTQESFGSNESD